MRIGTVHADNAKSLSYASLTRRSRGVPKEGSERRSGKAKSDEKAQFTKGK